eukprot:350583-Chlamydomonas_euryale.AAC.3
MDADRDQPAREGLVRTEGQSPLTCSWRSRALRQRASHAHTVTLASSWHLHLIQAPSSHLGTLSSHGRPHPS